MNAQLFERQTPWNETYDVRVSEPNAAGDLLYLLDTSSFNQTCVGSHPKPSTNEFTVINNVHLTLQFEVSKESKASKSLHMLLVRHTHKSTEVKSHQTVASIALILEPELSRDKIPGTERSRLHDR